VAKGATLSGMAGLRFNVHNKAHNQVLVLIIYCRASFEPVDYVSVCKPITSLWMRRSR